MIILPQAPKIKGCLRAFIHAVSPSGQKNTSFSVSIDQKGYDVLLHIIYLIQRINSYYYGV